MKKTILLSLAFLLVTTAPALSEIRHVPDEYATIQDAIDDCNNGDVVIVGPNTYTGVGNRDIDFGGNAITLRSTDPNDPNVVAATIIDCNAGEADYHRGFYFHSGEDANSVLAGFTVTNGYAEDGAGIKCSGSSPSIINCTISNCTSVGNGNQTYYYDGGGGINCENFSSPTISNCTISGNAVYGLFAHDTGFGGKGGGIRCYESSPTIINCTISGNKAEFSGGGILARRFSSPIIVNCIISRNKVDSYWSPEYPGEGGGLWSSSTPVINNCTIAGNAADGSGGGIYCAGGSITLDNCTISGNSATGSGGGIVGSPLGGMAVRNCTVSGNTAEFCGGGIYCYGGGGATTISNCILWGSTAVDGPELGVDNNPYQGATATVEYSDVQGGAAGVYLGAGCTLNWQAGNIDVDPCFVSPGYWADTNDPNIHVEPNDPNAVWLDGDYHLQSQAGRWDPNSESWVKDANTSPCVDAGDMANPIGFEPFPNGGRVNMGTYGGTAEASKSYFGEPVCETIVAGDINGDCKVNFLDFAFMAYHWLEDNNP